MKRPVAIDFFAGAGGISLGLIQAGFEVLGGVEYDVPAACTYLVNLGSNPVNLHFVEETDRDRMEKFLRKYLKKENGIVKGLVSGSGWIREQPGLPPVRHFWIGDIRKLTGRDILKELGLKPGDIDLVAGGPPCQGFSYAGKREIMDPRNSLIFEFAQLILDIQPKAFFMENVPGIMTMVTPDGIPVIDAFCRILADGGFSGYEALMKSLLSTAGVGAAIKGSVTTKDYKDEREKESGAEVKQLSLFL